MFSVRSVIWNRTVLGRHTHTSSSFFTGRQWSTFELESEEVCVCVCEESVCVCVPGRQADVWWKGGVYSKTKQFVALNSYTAEHSHSLLSGKARAWTALLRSTTARTHTQSLSHTHTHTHAHSLPDSELWKYSSWSWVTFWCLLVCVRTCFTQLLMIFINSVMLFRHLCLPQVLHTPTQVHKQTHPHRLIHTHTHTETPLQIPTNCSPVNCLQPVYQSAHYFFLKG